MDSHPPVRTSQLQLGAAATCHSACVLEANLCISQGGQLILDAECGAKRDVLWKVPPILSEENEVVDIDCINRQNSRKDSLADVV